MRVSGVPFDQGRHPQGAFPRGGPNAGVLHRTYGAFGKDTYKGAYSIGKNGRDIDGDGDRDGIGFHFLIGKNEGQWNQFYDTATKAAHAKGANDWALGIEFDGVNADVLTDWQVRAAAHIMGALSPQIPLTYYDGRRIRVTGWLNHASVPGSDHTDKVTREDFNRILALIRPNEPQPSPPPIQLPTEPIDDLTKDADMYIAVEGVGFFAQVGNVTIPLVGLDLAGFGRLTSSNKSVGVMVLPQSAAADFGAKTILQTRAATV